MAEYPLKIMVAVDGSDISDHAIRHAAELYGKVGTEFHMVMVGMVSHWTHPDNISPTQLDRIRDETEKRLAVEKEKALKFGVDNVFTHVRLGKIDAEIVRATDDLGIGMLVIGNRGMGSLERMLLGNDVESVVRHSKCGVLVVRER